MGRLDTAQSLAVGDAVRLAAVACLVPVLSVAVSAVSFGRLRTGICRWADRLSRFVPGTPSPARVTWAVTTTDRYLPGERKCLLRSLTTETVLRLYGYDPTHRIGVDRRGEGIEAHSWLEHEGEILIGDLPDLDRYDPLPPLQGGSLV